MDFLEPGKAPLSQAIAARLQDMIRSGRWLPGQRLPPQRLLAEQLAVSRPSLREALFTLETLGLVRTLPARGTFVADPARREPIRAWRYEGRYDLREVLQTRALLEPELCRLAAAAATPADLDAMRSAALAFADAWTAGDLVAHVEADLALHRRIATLCPNGMLTDLYHSLQHLLTETQRHPLRNTDAARMAESIAEHWDIVERLALADGPGAAGAMARHIRNTADRANLSL